MVTEYRTMEKWDSQARWYVQAAIALLQIAAATI
jgi:hypothetical protein